MLRKLIRRLRSRLALRRLTAAQRLAYNWTCDSEALQRRLDSRRKRLEAFERVLKQSLSKKISSLKGQTDGLAVELGEALRLQKHQEEVVAALRSENQVLTEITVPTLTAAHQLLLQRYRAESEIQVRRQVAAGGQEER